MSRITLSTVVVIALLAIGAAEANAFGHCGWGGRWGCGYGYGACGYGACGYGCGYGGCGYGGCGYAGGSLAPWGYGNWHYGPRYWGPRFYGLIGSPGQRIVTLAGAPSSSTVAAKPRAPMPDATSTMLVVNVPSNAKVFVNDRPTTTTGEHREYISRHLQSGYEYGFHVRAEFLRDGQTVTEEKTVYLSSGKTGTVDFTGPSAVSVSVVSGAAAQAQRQPAERSTQF